MPMCTAPSRQLALFRIADEILVGVDQLRFFAGAARNLEGRAAAEYLKDHTSFVRSEPIGVIGQVTPCNYPYMMAIWKVAPALAAGNTVSRKPSRGSRAPGFTTRARTARPPLDCSCTRASTTNSSRLLPSTRERTR